jgi:hypothetical protein
MGGLGIDPTQATEQQSSAVMTSRGSAMVSLRVHKIRNRRGHGHRGCRSAWSFIDERLQTLVTSPDVVISIRETQFAANSTEFGDGVRCDKSGITSELDAI